MHNATADRATRGRQRARYALALARRQELIRQYAPVGLGVTFGAALSLVFALHLLLP